MGERLIPQVEYAEREVLSTLIQNLEMSWVNARTLRDILGEAEDQERAVTVECLSSSMDIGGFFIDRDNSDPSYRSKLQVGSSSGDVLSGTLDALVAREVEGNTRLQLQVNVGDSESPVLCFFELDKTLEGCLITRN